jgi:hypothetical protein
MSQHFAPEKVIKMLADDVHDARFIGSYIPMPPWESVNFGVEYAGGYSTVIAWPPTRDGIIPDTWTLQLAAGLAVDVHDVEGALRWSNAKNRSETIGRYVVALSDSGLAAVFYNASVSSMLTDSDAPEMWIWMTRLMTVVAKIAAGESKEFISSCGGRQISEDFLAALTMITLSPE